MIEMHDLSSETHQSPLSAGGSSPRCSAGDIKDNTLNIKSFLKKRPEKYVLVENDRANTSKPSPCWTRFALPAIQDENKPSVIIEKFASCRSCYTTYTYTNGSTKSLNGHKYLKEPSSSRSPSCM